MKYKKVQSPGERVRTDSGFRLCAGARTGAIYFVQLGMLSHPDMSGAYDYLRELGEGAFGRVAGKASGRERCGWCHYCGERM